MANMKKLQILMPMGGIGKRFLDEGYKHPKPLIDVSGKEMFLRALESFDHFEIPKKHIFVIRKDQNDKYNLAQKIIKLLPDAQINILDHNTKGAAETCLIAKKNIQLDQPLIIMDCDFRFYSKEYIDKINSAVKNGTPDGILLCFNSDNPRYSYAKTLANKVIETAEKKVISDNAIAGAYYFNEAKTFVDAARNLLDQPISNNLKEYYLSLVYNILISNGKIVEIARIDSFDSFGTPEELKLFISNND